MPRARRITRKVCWVVSLFWAVAWPLAVSIFEVGQFQSYHGRTEFAWATTVYPIAMLWLAYWLVAWFFWVRWSAVGAALFEPAPVPQAPAAAEPGPSRASELARS